MKEQQMLLFTMKHTLSPTGGNHVSLKRAAQG